MTYLALKPAKTPLKTPNLSDKTSKRIQKREKKARKALEHREKCRNHAELVKTGSISVRRAARECQITERQMAQYVARATKEYRTCSVET